MIANIAYEQMYNAILINGVLLDAIFDCRGRTVVPVIYIQNLV